MSNGKLIVQGYNEDGDPYWDHMEGTYVINGKNATYTYGWYDYDGTKHEGDPYVMELQKVK